MGPSFCLIYIVGLGWLDIMYPHHIAGLSLTCVCFAGGDVSRGRGLFYGWGGEPYYRNARGYNRPTSAIGRSASKNRKRMVHMWKNKHKHKFKRGGGRNKSFKRDGRAVVAKVSLLLVSLL